MAEQLNHASYVEWLFRRNGRGLASTYGNAIVHAALIEATVGQFSPGATFEKAINALPADRITNAERRAFHAIRIARHNLIHCVLKLGYDQGQIRDVRNKLMAKIIHTYKISRFLDEELFVKRGITRPRKIALILDVLPRPDRAETPPKLEPAETPSESLPAEPSSDSEPFETLPNSEATEIPSESGTPEEALV